MHKVLIIPSWYPTEVDSNLGIFFKEQALLMGEDFDVKVLYGLPQLIGRRKFFKHLTDPAKVFGMHKNNSKHIEEIIFTYPDVVFKSFVQRINNASKYYLSAFDLLDWKPDLIHVQSAFWAGLPAVELGNSINVPVLLTEHLPIILSNFNDQQKEVYLKSLKKADKLSVVSEFAKRVLIDNHPESNPLVHGNLVDECKFEFAPINSKEFHVGWCGSAYHRKDPFVFLKAVSNIKKKVDVSATMVFANESGDFTLDEVECYANELGLRSNIEIRKKLDRKSMNDFYNSLDVFVSTSNSETFGLMVAEAMMCGVPVVATNNGGVRDIISNEKLGVIVPLKDDKAIAEYLIRISSGQNSFDRQYLRSHIIDNYGRKAFKQKVTKVYLDTIEG